jgi:hypothetical protein
MISHFLTRLTKPVHVPVHVLGFYLLACPARAHTIHAEYNNAPLAGVDVCVLSEMSFMRSGENVTGEGCTYLDINTHCPVQGRTGASGDLVVPDVVPRGWIVAKHDRWGNFCQTGSVTDRTLVRFRSTTLEFRIRTSTGLSLSGPITIAVASEGRRWFTQNVIAKNGSAVLQTPVGKFEAWVRAAGFFITETLKPEGIPEKRTAFDVRLIPMTPLAISVINRTTRNPVVGASVRGDAASLFRELVNEQSDSDGKVMLTSLSGSDLERLTVRAEGYLPLHLRLAGMRPTTLQIELTPKSNADDSRIESFDIDLPLKRLGESDCVIDRAVGPIPKGLRHGDKVIADDLHHLSCTESTEQLNIDGWPGGTEHLQIERNGKSQILEMEYSRSTH